MGVRRECPFCGNLHVKVRATGKTTIKTFVECPRCKARGPVHQSESSLSEQPTTTALNEAAARWDEREATRA